MKGKLILPYIMTNMLSGVGSAVMFWFSNYDPIWIGTFFATFTMPFFLMALVGGLGISKTSKNLPIIQLINLAAVAFVAYTLFARGGPSKTAEYVSIGLSIYGMLSMQWYIHIFSNYKRTPSAAIVKGQALPELPLHRLDKSAVSSAEFAGDKTLFVFFRANWCPFCMNQLKDVAAQSDRLAAAGVKVKFISNQGFDNSAKLAGQMSLPAHFEILQDEDLLAAKTLGIEDMGGAPSGIPGYPNDTVMATVIAVDEQRNVIFGDETDNYRRRPHPDTFLNVFERNNGNVTQLAA
ncbi:MAG: redoxin domain-containing protein [Pseudomonadota bacterium]